MYIIKIPSAISHVITNACGSGPPRGRGSDKGSDRDRGSSRYSLPALDNRTRKSAPARGAFHSSQGSPSTCRGFEGRGRGRGRETQRDLSSWVTDPRTTSNQQNDETASSIVTRSQSASSSVFRQTSDSQQMSSSEQNTGEHSDNEFDLYEDEEETDLEVSLNVKDILLEIRREVKQTNRKFDSMKKSIKGLKESNNQLLHENVELRESVSGLTTRVENLESIIQSNCEHTEKLRPSLEEATL